jgi:hypothetical protein
MINLISEGVKMDYLEIASNWDKYCDFFGGKNLESKESFESGDIQERLNYLIHEFEE